MPGYYSFIWESLSESQYRSTAEGVTQGLNAAGITAIVTGATSGIGTETARVLALRGAHVYLAGRSVESAAKTKDSIMKKVPDAKLDILAPLDLSSQASVRKCAQSFLALNQPLSLLINNAGIMMPPDGLTEDGIEIQFGTNHIGHFLLTNLLLDKLKETANKTGIESRIVNVSSGAFGIPTKDDIKWKSNENKRYKGIKAYGISKLANNYHAQELTRRLQEERVTNVTANYLHPGVIHTNLGRHMVSNKGLLHTIAYPFYKTVPQGAATTCFVALHPSVKGVSGKFFVHSSKCDPITYNPLAEDEEAAKELWEVSVQLTSK